MGRIRAGPPKHTCGWREPWAYQRQPNGCSLCARNRLAAERAVALDTFVQALPRFLKTGHFGTYSKATFGKELDRFSDENRVEQLVFSAQGDSAKRMMSFLQEILDTTKLDSSRGAMVRLLVELSQHSHELPPDFVQQGIEVKSDSPDFMGGFADVFLGKRNGQTVALKRLRVTSGTKTSDELYQSFLRETLVWRQLQHPHILPILGVDLTTFADVHLPCMVSPWLKQGTLLDYLKSKGCVSGVEDTNNEAQCRMREDWLRGGERERLLVEVAEGLKYLHTHNIVHGDLRGTNVFIHDDSRAVLADFGLATIPSRRDNMCSQTGEPSSGSTRFMAPELLAFDASSDSDPRRTTHTDVYAFGCLALEIYTLKPPFHHIRNDWAVVLAVISNERPKRPTPEECFGVDMPGAVWYWITRCWARETEAGDSQRPYMANMPHDLAELLPVELRVQKGYPEEIKWPWGFHAKPEADNPSPPRE